MLKDFTFGQYFSGESFIHKADARTKIIAEMFGSEVEHAKALAYRLFTIAERKGWAQEAYAYNSLVIAWPDVQMKAAELQKVQPEQLRLF